MFPSLPSSLLSLVLFLVESRAVTLINNGSAAPSHGNIGDYVATGFGASRTPNPTAPATSTITPPATTGTGSVYASSCNLALRDWSSSSFSYMYAQASEKVVTFSSAITVTGEEPGTTKVTSVITLCDGYPRVVGHISTSGGPEYTSTDAWTNTYTSTMRNTAFPTPAPCSIQPDDCRSMSSSFNAFVSREGSVTEAPPICDIPYPTQSWSTGSNNQTCSQCMIVASTARLMYWPITTAPGVGDLCTGVSTITGTPTGSGPNTYVTEGITITSPTVAISFGYMSRADKCGKTVDHTIIPVKPEEVTSVRGFRALFEHHQFDFADLDYHCNAQNSTNFTLANGAGDSCYQAVPADAYFGGLNNAVVYDQGPFRTMSKWQKTIYNDYQPQILPPQTMSSAIDSIWGDHCIVHPDGVWDPPIALQAEPTLDLPSYGPGYTDGPQTTISASPGFPFAPDGPAETDGGVASPTRHGSHFTALPETGPEGSGVDGQSGSGGQSGGGQDDGIKGPSDGPGGSDSGGSPGGDESDGVTGGSNNGGSSNGGSFSNGGSSNREDSSNGSGSGNEGSGSAGLSSGSQSNNSGGNSEIAIGSETYTVTSSASHVQVLANGDSTITLTQGGPAATINSQAVSFAPSGKLVIGSGAQATTTGADAAYTPETTIVVVNSKTITAQRMSNGAWVMPGSSSTWIASPGGSAVEVDAVTFSAASTGLVRAGGSGGSGAGGTASGSNGLGSQASLGASDGDTDASQTTGSGSQNGGNSQGADAESSATDTPSSGVSGKVTLYGSVWALGLGVIGVFAM